MLRLKCFALFFILIFASCSGTKDLEVFNGAYKTRPLTSGIMIYKMQPVCKDSI